MNEPSTPPVIGLALGGGAARGWAHVGVIRALEEAGVNIDLVCGTSIGALVGAAYAAGELEQFEKWILEMGIKEVISYFDVRLNGGLLKGENLMAFYRENFVDQDIDELPISFGAVATALHNGAEVWLRNGSTTEAVRASIALPGLFVPVLNDGRLLVDGGLVNPVPISLARAMGADIVIAVDLNSDVMGRHLNDEQHDDSSLSQLPEWMQTLQKNLSNFSFGDDDLTMPSMLEVIASSINIMQVRITRSRMVGDPPDVTVNPKLGHFGLMEFHRAQEAIEEGRRATEAIRLNLENLGLINV